MGTGRPKGSLRNESFWGFPWRLIELLDVRLWLYAAEKRDFVQFVFFPLEIKKQAFSTEAEFFPLICFKDTLEIK